MSVKEALHYDPSNRYLPMGGANGGTDCDPLSSEARGWTAASPRHRSTRRAEAFVRLAVAGRSWPRSCSLPRPAAHGTNSRGQLIRYRTLPK